MRCGKCENCLKLDKVKTSVLRTCGTPNVARLNAKAKAGIRTVTVDDYNHGGDDARNVWNQSLAELPCLNQPS